MASLHHALDRTRETVRRLAVVSSAGVGQAIVRHREVQDTAGRYSAPGRAQCSCATEAGMEGAKSVRIGHLVRWSTRLLVALIVAAAGLIVADIMHRRTFIIGFMYR